MTNMRLKNIEDLLIDNIIEFAASATIENNGNITFHNPKIQLKDYIELINCLLEENKELKDKFNKVYDKCIEGLENNKYAYKSSCANEEHDAIIENDVYNLMLNILNGEKE